MPAPATKTNRLRARFSEPGLETVKLAALMEGRSVSDFIVTAAVDAAQKAIRDTNVINKSPEDREALHEAMRDPPKTSALRNAAGDRRRSARKSR